jgi:hypothetical protein
MRLFRLVNHQHDPIEVGTILTRTSNHSNQKMGKGMYFATTRDDALRFAKTQHRHVYTHLLGCQLEGTTENDFIDLVEDPNLIVKSEFRELRSAERGLAYAKKYGRKGLIWRATNGWTEVCLFADYVQNVVIIESVEALDESREV